jgi:hypothetical protein
VSAIPKLLTPEMVRDYVDCQGTHCPFCHSSEIEAGKVEADGASAWSPVTCNECGKEWQDVFFLGGVDLLDENGRCGGTIMPAAPEDPGSNNSPAPACPPDLPVV